MIVWFDRPLLLKIASAIPQFSTNTHAMVYPEATTFRITGSKTNLLSPTVNRAGPRSNSPHGRAEVQPSSLLANLETPSIFHQWVSASQLADSKIWDQFLHNMKALGTITLEFGVASLNVNLPGSFQKTIYFTTNESASSSDSSGQFRTSVCFEMCYTHARSTIQFYQSHSYVSRTNKFLPIKLITSNAST